MAETRRGLGGDTRGERLPWLEPVEDEDDYRPAGDDRRWAAIGGVVLLAAALLIAGLMAFRHWHAGRADIGGIIRAPAGPYKVRPQDAGGLKVDTSGVVAEQTGTGADVDAPLALAAPEQPIVGPGSQPPPEPPAAAPATAAPATAAARPVPAPSGPAPAAPASAPPAAVATPVPASAADGGIIQLGAFSSEAKAKAAWKALSHRFAYLAPMTPTILKADSNGAPVWRLRASGGEPAARLCARLQVAGEACAVIG